jgi:hypothetical protein
MCKELPVIPVNMVVDLERIIRKMEGRGGGEAQGVADPKNISKGEKIYQRTTKLPYIIPNGHKVFPMVIKYNNSLHSKALKNTPRFGCLV